MMKSGKLSGCSEQGLSKGHMIQLRNIEKTIKSPAGTVWLLRRINVDVKEGEFVTIMGPSGAGKTTLLSIVGMLDDGWAGEYMFADQMVHKLDRKKRAELNRRYVGFVFQSYHLLDNLTVQKTLTCRFPTVIFRGRSGHPWWRTFWTGSRSSAKKICIRTSFPVDSSSWWAWRARLQGIRSSFWLTSLRAISIPDKRRRSWSCSAD